MNIFSTRPGYISANKSAVRGSSSPRKIKPVYYVAVNYVEINTAH